jgi:ABC-type nitrate/sulfonate/bicarbonate transport system substrate-binding protein
MSSSDWIISLPKTLQFGIASRYSFVQSVCWRCRSGREVGAMTLRSSFNFQRRLAFALAIAFLCISPARTVGADKRIAIVSADFSERAALFFVAKDQRFFEEQGIDADVVQVRSGPIAISALAAGEAQFYGVSATGASLGAMAGGLDLAFVAGFINRLDGYLAVSAKIRAPDDLKGKTLGVQSIGGGIWMMTHMTLDHWGLSVERDKIQIRVIGDDSVLAQAVMTGAVDGAVLGYTFSRAIPRGGGHILAELPKLNVPYQGTGLVARRSFIDSSPDTVEKTLKALIRANRFIQDKNNQPAVIRSLKSWLRIPPTQNIEDIYERMSLLYDRTITPTRAGIQNALRVLSKADVKFAKLKADDLVDDRIARRLEKEGF